MKNAIISISLAIFASVNSVLAQSQEISPALQAKFDAQLKLAQEWARDPVIVDKPTQLERRGRRREGTHAKRVEKIDREAEPV